jgi:hypothetical protein
MFDRLNDLYDRVQHSRQRIGELAEQAAGLHHKVLADSALVESLDKLGQAPGRESGQRNGVGGGWQGGRDDGEDGGMISEAWEIALINEEGK